MSQDPNVHMTVEPPPPPASDSTVTLKLPLDISGLKVAVVATTPPTPPPPAPPSPPVSTGCNCGCSGSRPCCCNQHQHVTVNPSPAPMPLALTEPAPSRTPDPSARETSSFGWVIGLILLLIAGFVATYLLMRQVDGVQGNLDKTKIDLTNEIAKKADSQVVANVIAQMKAEAVTDGKAYTDQEVGKAKGEFRTEIATKADKTDVEKLAKAQNVLAARVKRAEETANSKPSKEDVDFIQNLLGDTRGRLEIVSGKVDLLEKPTVTEYRVSGTVTRAK